MAHLFDELNPPAGRALDRNAVAHHWGHADGQRKRAQRAVEVARKQLEQAGSMSAMPARHALQEAEEGLSRAQGDASRLFRRIVEETARGDSLWTTERPMTPVESIDAEEHRDRTRRDAEAFAESHGLAGAAASSAQEYEMRETRRELQRLRAQLVR